MPKSECGRCKHICYGWVDFSIIFVVVSICNRKDVKFRHIFRSENNRQPLIVGNMLQNRAKLNRSTLNKVFSHLHNGDVNFPRLLVQFLVVPVWVEVAKLLGNSVMFPDPDGVEYC